MIRLLPSSLALVALLAIAVVLLLRLAPTGLSPGEGGDSADIVFSEARLVPEGDQLYLQARADIELPEVVRLGLDSGVPLEFVVELTLAEPRTLWPDKRIAQQRWRYRLIYYELTRHYRINAMDGMGSRNYRSLMRALDGLGSVRAVLDDLEYLRGRVATLSMRLDDSRLPLPLRPVLGGLIGSSWAVKGPAYRWTYDIDSSVVSGAA